MNHIAALRAPLIVWGGIQDPNWRNETECRAAAVRLLAQAERVFYRFPCEREILKDLTGESKLHLGGDPCFCLPRTSPKHDNKVALCFSRYLLERYPAVQETFSAFCEKLAADHELVAVWCETSDSKAFRGLLPECVEALGLASILNVLRTCSCIVGCRLHPLIVGMAQDIPMVGVEFGSAKIRWLMETAGVENALVDMNATPLSDETVMSHLFGTRQSSDRNTRVDQLADAARSTMDWIAEILRCRAGEAV